MDPLQKVRIGKTSLRVTRLGLGCSGLARSSSDEEAASTVRTVLKQGINYLDTAPLYGRGLSEKRLGHALTSVKRSEYIISTKVGRMVKDIEVSSSTEVSFDYSREGVLKSIESSLGRLGIESVDILYIHDPDNHYKQAIEQAYPTLDELRSNGVIKAVGAGMNQWEMELRFAEEGNFDCFLLAGRYTLLEQTALREFLPYCQKNNISVVIGGPYNSGILASQEQDGRYNYREPPKDIVQKTRMIKTVCDEFNVPMKAAALQFVLAHPAVASVIPGTRSPEHQEENLLMMKHRIPDEFWRKLKDDKLIDPEAPTP
jgi:D-threo-aldose 1-dehydrogenase